MIPKRSILICAFALLLPTGARAADEAVDNQTQTQIKAFIEELYSHYAPNQPALDPQGAGADRLFEPGVLGLMREDQQRAADKNEVPWLNGDVICNCQEFEKITDVKVEVLPGEQTAHMNARVTFANNGETQKMEYNLVPVDHGWKIYDIISTDAGSLRQFLEKAKEENFKQP